MIAMALPTILLYEAAILAVDRVERARNASQGEEGQTPSG
jgi:Sec-independent protein secretion pathway component TatC